MKQETVVFDLGGVVFNWQPLQLMREVFPARVSDDQGAAQLLADVFQSHNTDGDWAQWDLGLVKPHDLAERIAQRLSMGPHDIMALIDALAPHMRVKQDTVALIHDLKTAGHRLVYLSNMPEELAQWIERDHPFGDWFEDGVFSARVQHAKPDDGIYHCAVDRLSLHGQAPVFVDDMPRNVATAQRLGWRPVQFDTAAQVRQQLQAWGLLG
jgi:2-haloacid dehalogenase/putative hydrolase of the HAD superfamily